VKLAGLLASIVLLVACSERTEEAARPYEAAYYVGTAPSIPSELSVFPFRGNAVTVGLPVLLGRPVFSSDGRAIYGAAYDRSLRKTTLSRVELSPIRVTMLPGVEPFLINNFAITAGQDLAIISGSRKNGNSRECGIFAVGLDD